MGWRMSERQGSIQGPHFLFFLQLALSPHLVFGRIVGAHPAEAGQDRNGECFSIGKSKPLSCLGGGGCDRGQLTTPAARHL